jgi:hypothetical protein
MTIFIDVDVVSDVQPYITRSGNCMSGRNDNHPKQEPPANAKTNSYSA